MLRRAGMTAAVLVSVLAPFAVSTALTPAAAPARYVEAIPGSSVTFEMVPVPAGTFRMGSPPTERGRGEDEGPPRDVALAAFWIGANEVTWDEYDRFWLDEGVAQASTAAEIKAAGADALTRPTPPYADESFGFGKGRRPVISVTHHAAMEYTRWLSRKTGRRYRLPTEAEWEYACRAGTSTAYSFGDDAMMLRDHAWYGLNAGEEPHPVGGKKPNAWGLHDMHGNVAEWVLDRYDKDAYAASAAKSPVAAPVVLPGPERFPHVVRGGSWDHDAPDLRCAARLPSSREWIRRDPQNPKSIWWLTDATFVGFRVARAVDEGDPLAAVRSRVTKESQ